MHSRITTAPTQPPPLVRKLEEEMSISEAMAEPTLFFDTPKDEEVYKVCEPSKPPSMVSGMLEDLYLIPQKDPATPNALHAFFFSPGLWAIWLYRIAHALWTVELHFLAKLITLVARLLTSIEIHPGARIGRRFSIDHGSGVVVGETAVIGDDCLLFQGVTLGGTGKEVGKRHPTLGCNVVVGSGAKVLGSIFISNNSKIGAGSVVVKSIPEGVTVVGVPGRAIQKSRSGQEQEQEQRMQREKKVKYPDVDAHAIRALYLREQVLVDEVNGLKKLVEKLMTSIPNARSTCCLEEGNGIAVENLHRKVDLNQPSEALDSESNSFLMLTVDSCPCKVEQHFEGGEGI